MRGRVGNHGVRCALATSLSPHPRRRHYTGQPHPVGMGVCAVSAGHSAHAVHSQQAAAPAKTLELLFVGLAAGALILIPSLRLLFKTFSPMNKNAPMT